MKYQEIRVELPKHDADVVIVFPGGKELTVQARPSNADVDYNGSLDIILPDDQLVTAWQGDDMEDSVAPDESRQHERRAKQLVTDLPGDYE
jgi:hypothetical protein